MSFLKDAIRGTSLEAPARGLLRLLRGASAGTRSEWEIRGERDEINVNRILRRSLRRDSNCIDIGANEGIFLQQFQRLAPAGRHFAFEPLPEFAAELKRGYPKAEVFHCALSNCTGKATFHHVLNLSGWSGLKTQPYPVEAEVKTIEVDLLRLDDVIPEDVPVDFIKIDVEGAELEVLEGGLSTIKRHKPTILFEHAKIHNQEYETTPEKVFDLLVTECGLGIYSLAGEGPFSKAELTEIYHSSHASNYDRKAQTNFIAKVL
jgi:FkbM family methyltransferase